LRTDKSGSSLLKGWWTEKSKRSSYYKNIL